MKRPHLLSALRVRHFAHFLLLPLAGFDAGAGWVSAAAGLVRGELIAFCLLAFGYLINGVADRRMDRSAKNSLADHAAPGPAVFAVLFLLAVSAVALSSLGPPLGIAATLVCLVSGVVYSVGPRLKRKPLIGTLLNVTNFAPLLWLGLA